MRNILFLALCLAGLSCAAGTPANSSLEYLRCPDSMTANAMGDVASGGSDTSLFGSSSKDNEFNCLKNPSICGMLGANFSCDPRGCCYEAKLGYCSKSSQCPDNAKPVCDLSNNNCVPCDAMNAATGKQQCTDYVAAQNDPLKQVLCIGGTCHECTKDMDCTRPGKGRCNMKTFTCGGCTDNSQCASGICKVDDSLLLETGDDSTHIGDCANQNNVVYVDIGMAGCAGGDGSMGNPFCQIPTAINTNKPYIHVVGRGTTAGSRYGQVTVTGKKVAILGSTGLGHMPSSTSATAIDEIIVNGGSVTLNDVVVVSTSGTAPAAVQCSGAGTLFVQKSSIVPIGNLHPATGITANGCKVTVEKTKIFGAFGYGLWITGGSNHRVVNNAIIGNGSLPGMGQLYGIKLTSVTTGQYSFNTVAGNGQGVQCDSSVSITDSLVTANGNDPQITANCMGARNVTTGVTLMNGYATGGDPKIATDGTGANQCFNKANDDVSVVDDYDGNVRPMAGGKSDIGCFEQG